MAKRLQIIECAYRATLEEQDDPVLWITHAMRGAGGEFDVLLRGNAVNYAVRGQDASGLAFGAKSQTQPPRIDEELHNLTAKGVDVFAVEEEIARRGIVAGDLVEGVRTIKRSEIAPLLGEYAQVWHW